MADAYLGPVIGEYLGRVGEALPEGATLHVMTSAGGLVSAGEYRAKDSLLSGPAGGVVGVDGRARGRAGILVAIRQQDADLAIFRIRILVSGELPQQRPYHQPVALAVIGGQDIAAQGRRV